MISRWRIELEVSTASHLTREAIRAQLARAFESASLGGRAGEGPTVTATVIHIDPVSEPR